MLWKRQLPSLDARWPTRNPSSSARSRSCPFRRSSDSAARCRARSSDSTPASTFSSLFSSTATPPPVGARGRAVPHISQEAADGRSFR